MNKYLALIKIQFKENFAYRISTIASIIVGIIQVYVYYMIWKNVYNNTASLNGFSLKQICTYVILANVLYKLVEFGITLRISDLVKSGEITIKLTKPIGLIGSLFFESMGGLASNLFTLVLPMLVLCLFVIPFYFQTNILVLMIFVFSTFMGIMISIFIDIIFGLLTFWTENGWGLRVIRQAMIKLFSGVIVPLVFMPGWFGIICDWLPFKALIDVPVSLYIYGLDSKTMFLLLKQLVWVVVLCIMTYGLYKKIIKKMQINGG